MIGGHNGKPKPKVTDFLQETVAVVELRRELQAAERAAGVAFVEYRSCRKNFEFHLQRVTELQKMLATQMDRRRPERRELGSPANRRNETSSTRGRVREGGFSLIEMLVSLAMLGLLMMAVIPSASAALYRSRMRDSMAQMERISIALQDRGIVEGGLSDLTAAGPIDEAIKAALRPYLKLVPEKDAWGGPIYVTTGELVNGVRGIEGAGPNEFLVESFGADKVEGPGGSWNPDDPAAAFWAPGTAAAYAQDLAIFTGSWIVGPRASYGLGTRSTRVAPTPPPPVPPAGEIE